MKSLRLLLTVVVVTLLSTVAFAQSDSQKSFDKLKTLAGSWQGPVTATPAQPDWDMSKPMQVTLRVTSRGNALAHEMKEAGTPDDSTRFDHPLTMLYLDSDRLYLTHYCDAGNRPRMTVKVSADGKTFHAPGCSFIHHKTQLRAIPASEALNEGYVPCVRCMRKYLSATVITHPHSHDTAARIVE